MLGVCSQDSQAAAELWRLVRLAVPRQREAAHSGSSVTTADDNGHGGVVGDIVTDAAQEGAFDLAVSPSAAHDHASSLVIGCLDDRLPRLPLAFPDLARDLWTKS